MRTGVIYSFLNPGGEVCFTTEDGEVTAILCCNQREHAEVRYTGGLPRQVKGPFHRPPAWEYMADITGRDVEPFIHIWLSDAFGLATKSAAKGVQIAFDEVVD
jgi:hypothetical protein